VSEVQCPPFSPPPEEIPGTPLLIPPSPGATELITIANAKPPKLTGIRKCDAVTALKRGLKEYLEQIYLDVEGVRVRFEQVFESWAEPETASVFPSAAIMAVDEAVFDYSAFTPVLDPTRIVALNDGPNNTRAYLVKYAEVTVRLAVETYCSSPAERSHVLMMLEDALNPVDWMYGFKLDVPHYFNQRVVYEPMTAQMVDSSGEAGRRWRPGTVFLSGQISLMRVRSLPGLQPRVDIVVEDGST